MQAPIQEHNLGESSQGPTRPLQLEEKLNQLKAVLPSASDEKLATALLAHEKGDMNAVVQYILDSEPTEYEVSSPSCDVGQCRVIDLSSEATDDHPVPESSSTTESILSRFLQTDVETSTLTKILETVRENEGQSNLLSFHRPSSAADYQGNQTRQVKSSPRQNMYLQKRVHTARRSRMMQTNTVEFVEVSSKLILAGKLARRSFSSTKIVFFVLYATFLDACN